jgi:ABC-type multidrug transport system fused ATPase/permease subunit
MEKGRIVAEGDLKYLLEESAHFRELWKHQEKPEIDPDK